ncbi:hypothetical protein KXV95_007141 [Aspergillus fumigatus]|nr:hypothetical protein KXX26_008482 [Aspergillus fumigatus]KAH1553872.1 hypothetical protein KXX57_006277 [Aspergillus fumigatus]KAH1558137.1 hypothetical protein KXX37_006846 [Aspergillus fumigatus]KAH1879977.1 hypothetical protein KXW95_002666 [Aspergillus fumigatus]KAH1994137.1 hypothetical protein KXV33_003624 [Aspergillus fumigatus]
MEEAVNHRSFGAYYAGGMACGKGRVANVRTLHRTDVYGCEKYYLRSLAGGFGRRVME